MLFVFFSGIFQQEWIMKWNQLINPPFQPSQKEERLHCQKRQITEINPRSPMNKFTVINITISPWRHLQIYLRILNPILDCRNWWALIQCITCPVDVSVEEQSSLSLSGWHVEKAILDLQSEQLNQTEWIQQTVSHVIIFYSLSYTWSEYFNLGKALFLFTSLHSPLCFNSIFR